MSKFFTYSILQYKHSITLREVLNVGILFHFPEENKFEFINADGYRPKTIYPDFDQSLFNSYLKSISSKVKNHIDLFNKRPGEADFAGYIHTNILPEDAAGLVFSDPVNVENVFINNDKAVAEFSKLLLPGINFEKQTVIRHNEQYIIRKFHGYIFKDNKSLESRFIKDEIIKTKHFNIKFDFSFKTSERSAYIKPINFDFIDENFLQVKAATFFSYLTDLANSGPSKKVRYDFLLSKPQDPKLLRFYENALDLLESTKAPKQLIHEDRWEDYSQSVISELTQQIA